MSVRYDSETVSTPQSDASDSVLAAGVQAGDKDAFEVLARRYMRSVSAVVSSYFQRREDIDDTVQEAFLRVLERIHLFDTNRPFAPWLYQVARNVARNRWKAIKRERSDDSTSLEHIPTEAAESSPGSVAELSELRSRIADAIEELPERQRASFRLHDVEGFETSEIAEMLGVSEGTVRANLHHARRALREKLEPYARDWT